MKKIVVFAGSFNPPTIAHLNLAKQIVAKSEDVEKVIFSPVNDSYRKRDLASGTHRLEMTKLLVQGEVKLDVSDTEVKGLEYMSTYDCLKNIRSEYPDKDVCLLLGSDKLGQLRKWSNIKQLLTDFSIFLCSRSGGCKMELLEEHPTFKMFEDKFIFFKEIDELDVSSTMIRKSVKECLPIDNLTKTNVMDYIKENKLYLK